MSGALIRTEKIMMKYLITHGALKIGGRFVGKGEVVELTDEDAKLFEDCVEKLDVKEAAKAAKVKP